MSRIGKKAILIPPDISLDIKDEQISIKGKYGNLNKSFLNSVSFELKENELSILRKNEKKETRAYHGLIRVLIQNMIDGVQQKFTKILIAEGVGYKFQLDKNFLILNMGYTHPVKFLIPEDISIKIETPTKLLISGIDKEKVGFWAAKIRDIKPPEPYKGKGIRYEGEKIIRKVGKTGK